MLFVVCRFSAVLVCQFVVSSLHCSSHQSTTIKVWPFQRRLGRAKIEGGEETREDSGNADTEAEEKTPSTSDTSSGSSQSHDADLCRCYLGHCMHVIQLHIALLTAAGYNNVT